MMTKLEPSSHFSALRVKNVLLHLVQYKFNVYLKLDNLKLSLAHTKKSKVGIEITEDEK